MWEGYKSTTDGGSLDNPGHVAVAIEQYDENGNKNGMVTVFETSLPVRIREEIKGDDKLTDLQKLYQKHKADYSIETMSRSDFEKRNFDSKFEFATTMEEDQTSTANLTKAATNEVPYVIGGNNCAQYANSAIPKRFGEKIGKEKVNDYISISTPNQTAKDLTKLAGTNSQVSERKSHDDVSKLPTATKMAEKQ